MERSEVSWIRRLGDYARRKDLGFLATAMSPRWFFMDFYVYPPLIVLCLGLALDFDGSGERLLQAAGLVAIGLLVWTLAEYLIHRFAFHHVPGLMDVHLEHHAEPTGLHGSPTVVTVLVFGLLVLLPLWGVSDLAVAAALTAGLMTGYLAYVTVHYVVHNAESPGPGWVRPTLRYLRRAHAVHHHQFAYNFGVTTTIWDRVFGTLHRR